jgi:proteic killer suppression protein
LKIHSIKHKGLRRLIEDDNASGLPPDCVPKLRRMISFLQDMRDETELRTVPSWKAHKLVGDRHASWSLFVTRNWRLTFLADGQDGVILDLNYEDYH